MKIEIGYQVVKTKLPELPEKLLVMKKTLKPGGFIINDLRCHRKLHQV